MDRGVSWNFWPTDSFQGLFGVDTVRRRCPACLFRDGLSVSPLAPAATVLSPGQNFTRPCPSLNLAFPFPFSILIPISQSPILPPSIVYSFFSVLSLHHHVLRYPIRPSPLFFLGPPSPGVTEPLEASCLRATPWCLVLSVPLPRFLTGAAPSFDSQPSHFPNRAPLDFSLSRPSIRTRLHRTVPS